MKMKLLTLFLAFALSACSSKPTSDDKGPIASSTRAPQGEAPTQMSGPELEQFLALEKQTLKISFKNYVSVAVETIEVDLVKEFQRVSALKLNLQTDQEFVDQVVLTLVRFDKEDPSRTSVMMLSASYNKYPALYKSAFQGLRQFESAKKSATPNIPTINEIEKLMARFNQQGNG